MTPSEFCPSDFWPSDWIAVALSREVRSHPIKVMVDLRPVVLFRALGRVSALSDICPHRSAPFSAGRVVDGNIECPYHGWQFDGTGHCRKIPGLVGETSPFRVAAYDCTEVDGLIFVRPRTHVYSQDVPYVTALKRNDTITAPFRHQVRARLADVADNILDPAHTHYVHKGILRGLRKRRSPVQVSVTGGNGWVEARYEGEPYQDGLLTHLLEGKRSMGIGRFIYPGIVELEYWGFDLFGRGRMTMACTFHLRQDTPEVVRGIGVLSGPRLWGFGYLKAALFMPLFRIGVAQDVRILEACVDNRAMAEQSRRLDGPLDLLRPSIDAILRGDIPPVADAPISMEMEL